MGYASERDLPNPDPTGESSGPLSPTMGSVREQVAYPLHTSSRFGPEPSPSKTEEGGRTRGQNPPYNDKFLWGDLIKDE